MELSPELEKSIKTALSLFLDEHEAGQFMNLNYVTSLVKQGQLPWQALVSIGVHAAELYTQETDIEKAILQELVGQALEPVDTLFWSILPKPGEKPLEGEQARLLFHVRFALGFLLLAGADKKRSEAILHDMAATKVSTRGHSYYGEGSGILKCTDDVRQGKLQAAIYLLAEYMRQKDYAEILYLWSEAIACTPWATHILGIILPDILDLYVAECEKGDYDGPGLEWLWLFVEVGELLSLCEEYDSSGPAPNECKKESPQYLAWKIGQIAGRFAARWPDDPFGEFQHFSIVIGDKEFQSERGEEETRQAVMAILALLGEYDPARDWQKMRGQCLSIWEMSYSYSGMPLSEIGPRHDLYWAMRIGFADALLKHPEPLPDTSETVSAVESKIWRQIEDIVAQKGVQPLPREEVLKLVESEESTVLEFKASARWDSREKRLNDSLCLVVIKTVAAFLNGQGGRLLIGVSDDHEILGLSHDYQGFRNERDQYKRFIVDKVCNHIGKVECQQYVSIEFYKIGNKDICLLDVRCSDGPIYVREGDTADFYVRVENETRKLNTKEAHDYMTRTFPRRSSQT